MHHRASSHKLATTAAVVCGTVLLCVTGCASRAYSSESSSDSLTALYQNYVTWVSSLSEPTFAFFVRALLLLVVPSVLCSVAFFNLRCRLATVQSACFLLGTLLAFAVPLRLGLLGPTAKAWLFGFASFGLVTLPWGLAWLLTRTAGGRWKVAALIWVLLALSLILNFSRG